MSAAAGPIGILALDVDGRARDADLRHAQDLGLGERDAHDGVGPHAHAVQREALDGALPGPVERVRQGARLVAEPQRLEEGLEVARARACRDAVKCRNMCVS